MDSSKTDAEKNDSKFKTKIPPMPKTPSINNVNMESTQSKIPKRDVCSIKATSARNIGLKTAKQSKQQTINKASASMMDLNLPKKNSLPSSQSCFNSHRSVKSNKEPTPRLLITDKTSEIQKRNERAAIKRNLQSFETAKEKLQNYQQEFIKKFNLVKDELSKDERDLKLVCLCKNNEGQLVKKNQPSKIITMVDNKTLEELKISLTNFVQTKLEAIGTLDQLTRSPQEIGDTSLKDSEYLKQIEEQLQIEKKTFLNDFLKLIESLQANDKFDEPIPNKELEIKVKSLMDKVNELSKNLEESQTELNKIKKNCDQKCCSVKKELEEKNKVQSKKQMEFDELKKKYDLLEKEHFKVKSINKDVGENLTKRTYEWEDLNHKLKNCANNNVSLEAKNKDLDVKNKELQLTVDKLTMELNASENCDNGLIGDLTLKHADEMKVLTNELMNAQKQTESFKKEVQSLRNESIKFQKLESSFAELGAELNQANNEKLNLNQTIRNLTEKLETIQNDVSVTRDVQEELTQLQRVNNLNNEQIKTLTNELTKAQFEVKKLEEKIILDEKLLKVRTDLIDSLQKKENSQKIRLSDLFAEVGEKNNNLQMIKTEILTKTEQFQKLFSTLSMKQMEITEKEHMIKLLQESNDRAQNLRVRQETKIAKLEEEILELKEAISIYQDVVLPNNTLRKNLAMAEACRGDSTENLGFYVEERRKKRHIDISVKKYEK